MHILKQLMQRCEGATAIEYGLICGLLGIVVAVAGQDLVLGILDVINRVMTAM